MQNSGTVAIYHVSRRDGTALFLHPFVKRGSMLELTQSTELVGRYGREPRVESATMLRNELYRRIEEDVRDWINERRFIPRFLIASGAFLLVFLFLAAVVRDPLPVVDETLIALGVGIATFLLVGRRFEQSKVAAQRRVQLRSKVDAVVFSEDPFVHKLEEILQSIETASLSTLSGIEDLQTSSAQEIWSAYPDESARVVEDLSLQLTVSPYKEVERALKRGRLTGKLAERADHGEISPALVYLYHHLRRSAR